MTRREYFALDPPWPGRQFNLLVQIQFLWGALDRAREKFLILDGFSKAYESGQKNPQDPSLRDAIRALMDLTEEIEKIDYMRPELAKKLWFSTFLGDLHHGYWRADEGRFYGEPGGFHREIQRFLPQGRGSRLKSVFGKIDLHLEEAGDFGSWFDVGEEYEADIREARDLVSVGYYSTALFVLGRAVERALYELGQLRRITSIEAYGRTKSWDDASFHDRNEALYRADRPDQPGKMVTNLQRLRISTLIQYRNDLAHHDDGGLERDEALRELDAGMDILKEILASKSELKDSDGGVKPLTDLSIH